MGSVEKGYRFSPSGGRARTDSLIGVRPPAGSETTCLVVAGYRCGCGHGARIHRGYIDRDAVDPYAGIAASPAEAHEERFGILEVDHLVCAERLPVVLQVAGAPRELYDACCGLRAH